MITDLHHLPPGGDLDCDLCVVGAGPAGIALAREFIGTRTRVLLLAGGGIELDPAHQSLNKGESVGLSHTGHEDGRGRAFGGTGRLWAGQCLPLDGIDFEQRSWVPHSGWPISLDDLRPWYARAEQFFRVEGETYDEGTYAALGVEAPQWLPDALRTHFTVYTPQVDTGRFSLRQFRRSDTMLVLLNANVVQIELNEAANAVAALRLRSLTGHTARVRARAYVLAAGGIENARLLLASTEREPHGVGNRHDLVGRFFQEHPNGVTATLVGGDPVALQARFRLLYRGGRRYFPKVALAERKQREHRSLNCNAHLVFQHSEGSGIASLREVARAMRRRRLPDAPMVHAARIAANLGEVGRALSQRFVGGASPLVAPTSIRLQCYVEQAPNPLSRVTLSPERDALGVPQLRMDWRMTSLEREAAVLMTDVARTEFRRLGLGELEPEPWLAAPGEGWQPHLVDCSHHIGTTRMATTEREGVVDADAQVFGVGRLFVAGSSVFPTSGYANPTLTIVALAIRLAEHIKLAMAREASGTSCAA